jgi:phosphate transport system substrate-binding protein
MKRDWFTTVKALVAGAFAAAALAGVSSSALAQTTITIDGSSTVYPVTEAVAEEFSKEKKGAVKVTIGVSGTGGGFKKFVRGETDISNASRPILAREMEEAKKNGIEYIELPIAFDALTVVVNPASTLSEISVADLKKMWAPEAQDKVTRWSDVNPGWAAAPLKLYGPGADSGTFDYFTEAIVGKAKSSRGDYTASEDDHVLVTGVSGDRNAIGYFGFAYYVENKDKLKALAIVSKPGEKGVLPSSEAVIDGTYQPLSRPIFVYVNKKSLDTRPELKAFVNFYLENGADLARAVKYVPLPADAYEKGLERVKAGKTGTIFAGHADVGVKIKDLFERPLVNEPRK